METGRLWETPAPGEVRMEEKAITAIEVLPAEAPTEETPAQPKEEFYPTMTTMQDEAPQNEKTAAEAPSIEDAHAAAEAPAAELPNAETRADEPQSEESAESARETAARQAPKDEKSPAKASTTEQAKRVSGMAAACNYDV